MNSIEISMAPHRFDEWRVTEWDNDDRPVKIDYYLTGEIVFRIEITYEKGWQSSMKIIDYKRTI